MVHLQVSISDITVCIITFIALCGGRYKIFLQSFEDMVDGTPAGQYIWYNSVLYIYCPVGEGDIKEFLQSFEDMVDGTPAGQYIWYNSVIYIYCPVWREI